jgi:hypothetical protein
MAEVGGKIFFGTMEGIGVFRGFLAGFRRISGMGDPGRRDQLFQSKARFFKAYR